MSMDCWARADFSASSSSCRLEHDARSDPLPWMRPATQAWTGGADTFPRVADGMMISDAFADVLVSDRPRAGSQGKT